MERTNPGRRRSLRTGTCPGLVLSLLVAASCSRSAQDGTLRNVLLITLDTTRADVLSGDEASKKLAPNVAALAEHGVRFPRAYSVAPLTVPAHASLLTGLLPHRHGVRDNGIAALPGSARTLAEILQERGFDTAAFVSSCVLDRGFGLDQGFELYDQPELKPRTAQDFYLERRAHETAAAASSWLHGRDRERPFFLWVHFYDPHIPYEPAPEFLAQAGGDAYRGEIAAEDQALGELLAELERDALERSTLVVLTADHGESLGEHGEPTHGALCYEATLRVPLLFRFPAPPPTPGPARLASLVDLVPTLLALLGSAAPADLDGIDLFSQSAPADRGVAFESYSGYLNYGWSPLAGWVDACGKYLHSSRPEFYLVPGDPAEKDDRARERTQECFRAREHLGEVYARAALLPDRVDAQPELARALSALGYAQLGDTAQGPPSPFEPSDRPSPFERESELRPLLVAHALFQQGRYDECRPLVETIVQENPGHLLALDLLSLCLMQAQRFDEAQGFLRQRLDRGPERADTLLNLGLCLLELGRREDALTELRAAERLAPDEPAIQVALARAQEPQGTPGKKPRG